MEPIWKRNQSLLFFVDPITITAILTAFGISVAGGVLAKFSQALLTWLNKTKQAEITITLPNGNKVSISKSDDPAEIEKKIRTFVEGEGETPASSESSES